MPDIINSAIDRQAYAANTRGNLLSQVDKVIICISQNGLHVAGYGDTGKILMIRCHRADHTPDFLERRFGNEPLLSNAGKVAAIFVSSAKNLLVPRSLYKDDVAAKWFGNIHFVDGDESIQDLVLRDDKAHYLYTVSPSIKELAERYFPKARILPFAAHQFNKNYKTAEVLQCSVTTAEAYLTLYKNRQLVLHRSMQFSTAEDIAYYIKQVCMHHEIAGGQLSIICAAENPAQNNVIDRLAQYFPGVTIATGKVETDDDAWTGPVYLFQQLYSCVS